ncbi:MAG: ATP-binding protein [Candidatus Omnitrophica bacterium]|nr:ATP-binding protein [Candidatus Omnitrophota bacterium]
MEIPRTKELRLLDARLKEAPVVAILGPRQCGKTTLAKQLARRQGRGPVHRFDLEDPRDLARLEQPLLALEGLTGLVVIDEIQRRPELFPILRVLADKQPHATYLILGSASRDLIAQSSESLAGRISYLELGGFSLDILPEDAVQRLWVRGGFPRSYLAGSAPASFQWRQDFVTTFLERDIPNLGLRIPAPTLRRFWTMLAHYHGQLFNASEIGRSLSFSDATARRYLDLLSGTFLIRQLQPWSYNTSKRLVKRPKVYFRDSGLLHALLGLEDRDDVLRHPKLGASWEGFALEQAIQHVNLREQDAFFWAVHTGPELDLVFPHKGKLWGIEAKYGDAPTLTRSMHTALEELSLAHLWVLYPGDKAYHLSPRVSVVPLRQLRTLSV